MTLTLDWGDFDETFLVWSFTGNWSAEQFYNAIDLLKKRTLSKKHAVNIMVDMRQSLGMPKNLLTLLRIAVKSNIQNVGQIVVISQSNFWVQMFQILSKTVDLGTEVSVTFVATVDEAYSKLGSYAVVE